MYSKDNLDEFDSEHGECNTNSPELLLLKFLPTIKAIYFLGHHFGFHILSQLFHNSILGGHTLFFTAGLFWIK